MPVFTITVTAAEGLRVMNALCNTRSIPPTQANALGVLKQFIVSEVKLYEQQQAVDAALLVIPAPVDVILT